MTEPAATKGLRGLQEWIDKDPETRNQTTLADLLGVKQPSVSAWLRGRARPDAMQRELIEVHCGVPKEAWFTSEELQALRRARRRSAAA